MVNEQKNQGGRPKNINERVLAEALEPIVGRIASLEGGGGTQAGSNVPLSRGHFFLHLMAGMCIHRGEAAFNPQFLDTVRNNADDFYEAYCQIVQGDHAVESTTKQLLDDTQARLAVIQRERQDLADRMREMEAEANILRGATGEAAAEDAPIEEEAHAG
ncbi:MAG: hypothetical protein ACE5F1_01025 [Planctomycetota bacterium]